MSEKLVTVVTFGASLEAHVFKMHLEKAEIECFIQNQYLSRLGVGEDRIELQVREPDVDKALQIIKDLSSKSSPSDSKY
ncbi:MAG: DUF2007 domain-containing protein [Planctomycetota bacterium]